jgi:glutamate N-acetyltransferase/amino-acid N-acetyltransferase
MNPQPVERFRLAGVHCGLKPGSLKDLALVTSDVPCVAAGMFTTNRVKAAPVLYDQAVLATGMQVRAVVANAGNANACTGDQGMADAHAMARHTAAALGCQPDEVLVLSTGVIGLPMPMDVTVPGIEAAAQHLRADGWEDAVRAVMTTDTRPKLASVTVEAGYTITGLAKGAGMIAPHMATMLAVIATDAAPSFGADGLQRALKRAADLSFNRIVVDGDMSTNDTVLLLANGASGVEVGEADEAFGDALARVCTALAQAIVRDGEGATKFVTVQASGAPDVAAANAVAHSIAASPLCKTAFYGGDPNWGRVVCAAGYSGVDIDPDRLALWLLDANGREAIQLVADGQPLDYDEPVAIALMQGDEWGLRLDLGLGGASAIVWTCDLSHEYVTINGHYRT